MLPATARASALASRSAWRQYRLQHTSPDRTASSPASSRPPAGLTGSAKLFADAETEEAGPSRGSSSREHLRYTQGPVWTGDESTHDAVLRMLVDAHKPLRSGDGVKHNSADEKIKGWMRGVNMQPRTGAAIASEEKSLAHDGSTEMPSPHRTSIPPEQHRPWHATYSGDPKFRTESHSPNIKYGMFIRRKASADELDNLLELKLPPDADAKMKARVRELRRANRLVRRLDNAREGAIDYSLGDAERDYTEEEAFQGNRQAKGSSVLGAQKGAASGLRAWAGLVEDRIQRARGERAAPTFVAL